MDHPRHATGDVADMREWEFNRAPIGTGPFKLDSGPSASTALSANENFMRKASRTDGLTFLVVPDEAVRTAMMIEEAPRSCCGRPRS